MSLLYITLGDVFLTLKIHCTGASPVYNRWNLLLSVAPFIAILAFTGMIPPNDSVKTLEIFTIKSSIELHPSKSFDFKGLRRV